MFSMRRCGIVCLPGILLLILLGANFSRAADASPEVKIDSGILLGTSNGSIDTFKGIPYAKPPIGPLRWRPPQTVDRWVGVRSSAEFGAACPQTNPPELANGERPPTSEDCLTLNVWTPSHRDHLLPVMFWIHGGGNTQGSSSHRYYDGSAFARDGVVLVSINYRLGLLGFFAHPALTKEAGANAPLANYGLMDQIAALDWVHRNIQVFGGDPGKVTIFGESAGGQDVLCLMTAPSASGLFARAIAESPGLVLFAPTLAVAEDFGAKTVTSLGLGANATAAQLRDIPARDLVKQDFIAGGPIIDGRFLPQSPKVAFAAHQGLHIPLIIGTNSNEGSLMDPNHAAKWLLNGFTSDEVKQAHALYGTSDETTIDRELFRDIIFAAPVRWIARQIAETGQPVYVYRFSYIRQRQVGRMVGAPHGSEIPYVFDTWWQSPTGGAFLADANRAEAHLMHACWISFALTGTPHCPAAPTWPEYNAKEGQVLEFGQETAVRSHFDQAMLDLVEPHAINPASR